MFQHDLHCVEWDVKLYYTIPYLVLDHQRLLVSLRGGGVLPGFCAKGRQNTTYLDNTCRCIGPSFSSRAFSVPSGGSPAWILRDFTLLCFAWTFLFSYGVGYHSYRPDGAVRPVNWRQWYHAAGVKFSLLSPSPFPSSRFISATGDSTECWMEPGQAPAHGRVSTRGHHGSFFWSLEWLEFEAMRSVLHHSVWKHCLRKRMQQSKKKNVKEMTCKVLETTQSVFVL